MFGLNLLQICFLLIQPSTVSELASLIKRQVWGFLHKKIHLYTGGGDFPHGEPVQYENFK